MTTQVLLKQALAVLTAERERIVADIARVTQVLAEIGPAPKPINWTAARRAAVSRRMRRYWAAWRRAHA